MARLHYGTGLSVRLDPRLTRQITETIGAHATRGGWITLTDEDGQEWSILITPGIPVWLEPEAEPAPSSDRSS